MTFVESLAVRIHRISGGIGIDSCHAHLLAAQLIRELMQDHGGERVYVANGLDQRMLHERDEAIRRDRARGFRVRRLARKYLLSKSQVHRILKSVPCADSLTGHPPV